MDATETNKPEKKSLHHQFIEMEETLKHQVQLMMNGHHQYEYRRKLLTNFAKDLNKLIALTEREPRN